MNYPAKAFYKSRPVPHNHHSQQLKMLARRESTGSMLSKLLSSLPHQSWKTACSFTGSKANCSLSCPQLACQACSSLPFAQLNCQVCWAAACSPNCTLPSAHQSWEASSAFIGSSANCSIPRALHSKACSGSSSLPSTLLGCQACSGSSSLPCARCFSCTVHILMICYVEALPEPLPHTTYLKPMDFILHIFPVSGLSFTNPWLKSLDENDLRLIIYKRPCRSKLQKIPLNTVWCLFHL